MTDFVPVVRLAMGGAPQAQINGLSGVFEHQKPALLVSYFYYKNFAAIRNKCTFRDYVLDSGAFSAFNTGKQIDLQQYIDFCGKMLAEDRKLTEVFSLDVIGDAAASARNCEEMHRQGVPAIPTFHYGSDFSILEDLCNRYPKVALGGMVGKPLRSKVLIDRFVGQCFARVWPKKLHGFGLASEELWNRYPFHSTDATTWVLRPSAYGTWRSYGGKTKGMSVRGGNQKLRPEVDWYLEIERQLQARWKKQMEQLDL